MTFTYIDYLEEAVLSATFIKNEVVNLDVLGTSLGRDLKRLESNAEDEGYDVLGNPGRFRGIVANLLSLLYRVPGALPEEDIIQLRKKDEEYGGSWKRRGGIGAYFSAVRKIDRIEHRLSKMDLRTALENDTREEGILDDLGDLRRYLLLWESYWLWEEDGEEQ